MLDIQDNARRLGHHRWVCLQMFELLGTRATTVPEAALRPMLATHAHHLAWHASLLADRMPEIAELDTDALTTPVDGDVERALAAARATVDSADLMQRAYGDVLPRLLTECRDHLAAVDPHVDGPTAPVLTLIVRDLADDLAARQR